MTERPIKNPQFKVMCHTCAGVTKVVIPKVISAGNMTVKLISGAMPAGENVITKP